MDQKRLLERAVKAVKNGRMSTREASEHYSVPRSTIHDHVKKKRRYSGRSRPRTLSDEEEEALVAHILLLSKLGFGMDRPTIADVVKVYLDGEDRKTAFLENRPGADWMQGFLERHKHRLSVRKAEKLVLNRARGINQAVIAQWYDRLAAKLELLGITNEPMNIHNCDETGLLLESGEKKIICRRGTRNPLVLSGLNQKEMITVLFSVNAEGMHPPPFVLYKATSTTMIAESWTTGGPPGTAYGTSPSGWMTEGNFFQWMEQVFVPWVSSLNSDRPHLLILDGHASHISIRVKELADKNQIHLFLLPPHSSHILQPLDVACYGPLKVCVIVLVFNSNNYSSSEFC